MCSCCVRVSSTVLTTASIDTNNTSYYQLQRVLSISVSYTCTSALLCIYNPIEPFSGVRFHLTILYEELAQCGALSMDVRVLVFDVSGSIDCINRSSTIVCDCG